jgi:hypothetical protein
MNRPDTISTGGRIGVAMHCRVPRFAAGGLPPADFEAATAGAAHRMSQRPALPKR